jgi:hypothetical protein
MGGYCRRKPDLNLDLEPDLELESYLDLALEAGL